MQYKKPIEAWPEKLNTAKSVSESDPVKKAKH